MTQFQIRHYEEIEKLKEILNQLKGRKFKLDCGHHVTFGFFLGNSVTIHNGKDFKVMCAECGY